jgi:hypothetical protein
MGFWTAAIDRVRGLVELPRPITLDMQPLHTYAADLAPQPVDRLLASMRSGNSPVSREEALSVAAVQRGRNELCAIATIPLRLYSGTEIIPSPLMRQFDLDVPNVVHMSMTVEDLAFERIAWWRTVGRDFDGYPIAVQRIADPGTRVAVKNPTGKPQPDDGRFVWIKRAEEKGGWERVPSSDMIRFDSPNPGVLKANARAVRIARRLEELTEMYAINPALREYFTDADDAEDPMEETDVESFLNDYGASRQTRPYAWLPSNVKRADVDIPSPKDLTLADLQQTVMVAIANGLGVDPEDIGVSTTSRTYQNADDRRRDKINRMYAPYMRAITDRLSMGDVTRRGHEVRFDLIDYLKPDPAGRTAYYRDMKELVGLRPEWIAQQEGIPASALTSTPVPAPATLGGVPATFAGTGPAFTFNSADFAAATPAPKVDTQTRTITGLAVPYNAVAVKYGLKIRFMPGSLEYSDPARMAHLKDHVSPVGFHRSVTETADGPMVELAVLDGPEGSPAKAERDQLLYDAEHGLYSGLSIGVDYSFDPDAGDVVYNEDDDVYEVYRASWRETSTTYLPAFDDARVTKVAASLTGGHMFCTHCGQPHAPGIACATFAAQLGTQPTPTPAPTPGPNPAPTPPPVPTPADAANFAQFQAFIAAQQQGAQPAPGPVLINPAPQSVEVREPLPYRFDVRGNLRPGTHDFSADLAAGWAPDGFDQAARDRANSWLKHCFEVKEFGAAGVADQQFAITPANVVNLNYPQNHPEMYVDQMEYEYPLWNAVNKGTLANMTPFLLPKFNSSSGLVTDHVSGTEPTPGAFTATSQTITPSALSGKVEILRETWDQGGNPQASGLIWRQMVRAYYEGLEAYVQAQLVAAAASIPDITITTAAADSALDQAIADGLVPLQYIRGGDRFSTVFTQIDLYKAMVKAKDTAGRRLYPSINPQNSVGTTRNGYTAIDAHGKLWLPGWALAATGSVAASSWMFDPDVVCGWASAPERIDLQWRVAWVDVGVWGYKAFAITDFTRTRELVYDPV